LIGLILSYYRLLQDSTARASCFRSSGGQWSKGSRLGSQNFDSSLEFRLISDVSSSRLVSCKATSTTKNKRTFSRDELTDEERQKWEPASGLLEGLGFSAEESDKILAKAFGWVDSPYWSETTLQTVPEVDAVSSKVDFMKGLGFAEDELTPVLKKFPELFGCRETLMTHNLGVLDKEWGIKGNKLKSLIKRNPHVLGYTVDCKGDCMAQCTRCWVRF
jgi:hypothetical protein